MRIFPALLFICFVNPTLGYAEERHLGPSQAFQAGKEFAHSIKSQALESVSDTHGRKYLPHYNTNAPESGHFREGRFPIGDLGTSKMTGCRSYKAPTEFDQQECEAVNFLARHSSERPKYVLDPKTDPLISSSRDIVYNPAGSSGTAQNQCRIKKVITPATYTSERCTETYPLEQVSCSRILTMACDPKRDGCDVGGIQPNSWQGDMHTAFTASGGGNYILQFGTIADNYWGGYGAVYDRTLRFGIRDVDLITRFALTYASFDDWLLVKVNDVVVYVGPRGGDRLEVARGHIRYCATCYGSPELNTSWRIGLNINIAPYLKNGTNTRFTRTIVAGRGESAIQITTRQLCPRNCRDRWDNSQCTALEARTKLR